MVPNTRWLNIFLTICNKLAPVVTIKFINASIVSLHCITASAHCKTCQIVESCYILECVRLFLYFKFTAATYRFHYSCECPSGFGGLNCHLPGCGGLLTSQIAHQTFSIPDVTDNVIGCIWTIDSPPESRVNLRIDENSHDSCFDVILNVWSG